MLKNAPENISGKIIGNHVILDVIGSDVHYWSPQMSFRIEEDDEDPRQSIVSGLIGPRPDVWTMFMFVYFSIGFIGFFTTAYGVSKYLLGENTHFILAFPITILIMLSAYKAGKYGEHLGADQIELLKQFLRSAIFFEGDGK